MRLHHRENSDFHNNRKNHGYASHDYCITLHPTKCARDGYEYIKEHMAQYEVISVCGGDGMLNEAVSALMTEPAEKRPKLAYLPSGSTNDFAGTVGN